MEPVKLGESLEVALAVSDLSVSIPFYKKLGFAQVGETMSGPHPSIVLSDGTIHLGLHQYVAPSPSLVYFSSRFGEVNQRVRSLRIPLAQEMEMDGRVILIGFDDPNGQRIAVADQMAGSFDSPNVGTPMKIGKFGEFSIPTADRDASVVFYRQFGFEGQVYQEPYPWALLQDGLITIGIHQTPDFSQSTITYFSRDMVEMIKEVRKQGIATTFTNTNEQGQVHEAGIRSPDGQPFFLFYEIGW